MFINYLSDWCAQPCASTPLIGFTVVVATELTNGSVIWTRPHGNAGALTPDAGVNGQALDGVSSKFPLNIGDTLRKWLIKADFGRELLNRLMSPRAIANVAGWNVVLFHAGPAQFNGDDMVGRGGFSAALIETLLHDDSWVAVVVGYSLPS